MTPLERARLADAAAQRAYGAIARQADRRTRLGVIEDAHVSPARSEPTIPSDLARPYATARRLAWSTWEDLCRLRWEMRDQ